MRKSIANPLPLILASSSPYRAAQLEQAGLRFEVVPPQVVETPQTDENPQRLARRLATEKCQAVALGHPEHVVIAGDQVGALGTQLLGKPHTAEAALDQLVKCQGQQADFYSACAVYNPATRDTDTRTTTTLLRFRNLDRASLAEYITRDQPLDCAGSFKIERGGIVLFESVSSDDPTALIGLPMIELTNQLIRVGFFK